MNEKSDDDIGSFEVKIRKKTAKFTNMIIARFRESNVRMRNTNLIQNRSGRPGRTLGRPQVATHAQLPPFLV